MKHQQQLSKLGGVLRKARSAKDWSQRKLSAESGVSQANISKIETGQVDLQISSLLELARFLDLEFTLAPRQATPAIEAIVRDTQAAIVPVRAAYELMRLNEATRGISETLKRTRQTPTLALRDAIAQLDEEAAASTVLGSSFAASMFTKELMRIADQVASARAVLATFDAQESFAGRMKRTAGAARRIAVAVTALQQLRKLAANPASDALRPAYSLDDGD